MAVWGQDVEQVRRLSSQLNNEASSIRTIVSTLTSTLAQTEWTGPDADRFRNDWQSQHVPNLNRVIEALQETAQAASANAQAQESTSA